MCLNRNRLYLRRFELIIHLSERLLNFNQGAFSYHQLLEDHTIQLILIKIVHRQYSYRYEAYQPVDDQRQAV